MKAILLRDFSESTIRYRLEGNMLVALQPAPASDGCAGLATVGRMGLVRREDVLLAIYQRSGDVWLRMGEREWSLTKGLVRVVWNFVFPYVRRVRVVDVAANAALLDTYYWWRDINDGFPDDGDFLRYVAAIAANPTRLVEFRCFWERRESVAGPLSQADLDAIDGEVRRASTRGH